MPSDKNYVNTMHKEKIERGLPWLNRQPAAFGY